jgi:hypothetical protein
MNKLRALAVLVSLLATAAVMQAAELNYNFVYSVSNSATNAQFLVDGSFSADPTNATPHAPNLVGETFAVGTTGLGVTVFDLMNTVLPPMDSSVTYGPADMQNAGLVYFKSYNPPDGSADPIWTLSQQFASGPNEYLTLVMNGLTDSIYESSTLGGTGTLLATGPATLAFATNIPQSVPEPTTLALLVTGLFSALGALELTAKRS